MLASGKTTGQVAQSLMDCFGRAKRKLAARGVCSIAVFLPSMVLPSSLFATRLRRFPAPVSTSAPPSAVNRLRAKAQGVRRKSGRHGGACLLLRRAAQPEAEEPRNTTGRPGSVRGRPVRALQRRGAAGG